MDTVRSTVEVLLVGMYVHGASLAAVVMVYRSEITTASGGMPLKPMPYKSMANPFDVQRQKGEPLNTSVQS